MAKPATAARRQPARQPRGERTKSAILRCAVNLASVEGLEGLSIGRLAEELSMSKSGLFAHFGSKLELQLETIEAARQIFMEEIVGTVRRLAVARRAARLPWRLLLYGCSF